MKIICLLKTIWRTIWRSGFYLDGVYISGHEYEEQSNGDLVCKFCGDKISNWNMP